MFTSDNTPKDHLSTLYPVSIKGVILHDNKVILLKNEREEWELPGGKLETMESPELCLAREIEEELMLSVQVDQILDCWIYVVTPTVSVLIVTYGCKLKHLLQSLQYSHEHKAVGLFSLDEIFSLKMPEGYKQSILRWVNLKGWH